MSIRTKLNFAVSTLIVVFLIAAGFAFQAMRQNMASAREYSRTRDVTDLIANLHAGLYRHLRPLAGDDADSESPPPSRWIHYALRDINVHARLAREDEERALWSDLLQAVTILAGTDGSRHKTALAEEALTTAHGALRALRSIHRSAEYDSLAMAARTNLRAFQAIWIACTVAVLLFLLYLLLVRRWLLRPIGVLKTAADAFGRGELDQHVELRGNDELAQLARRLEAMATRLADHQRALLKARELAAVGEVCVNVAHGLRNPLTVMQERAQLAAEPGTSSEALQSVIHELMHQAKRLEERVGRLFDYSRRRSLHREQVTFRQIALTAKAHALDLLKQRDLKLSLDDRTNEAYWQLDSDALAQAIGELMINAARHSAANGEITISADILGKPTQNRRLQIRVIDCGAGMTPDQVERAFNFFFTTRSDGTGMGLALVRRIVEQHGGETRLESQIGRGTAVTIVLPDTEPMWKHASKEDMAPE